MTYDAFFAGVGGTLVGALITVWFTYGFQKKLLQQQLDFQKRQADADAAQRKEIAAAQIKVMETAHRVLRDLSNHVGSLNLNLAHSILKKDQQ